MYMNTPVLHRICIDRTAPKPVSPVIYGWHYEEIGTIPAPQAILAGSITETPAKGGFTYEDGVQSGDNDNDVWDTTN